MEYVFGRPREHDRKQIFIDLLLWSTNPTAFNLIQFTRPRMLRVTKLSEWAAEDDNFREALALAKESIAMNRFEAAIEGALPFAEVHRSEHNYDPLYKASVREEKEYDLSLELRKLDHAHKLKTKENDDLAKQDAERLSNSIKAKSMIKECG
jgi:hypothetical protein